MSILREVLEKVKGSELTNMVSEQSKIDMLHDSVPYLIERIVQDNRFKDIELAYVYSGGLNYKVNDNVVYVDRKLPITIYLENYRGIELSLGIRLESIIEQASTDGGCIVRGTLPRVVNVWIDTLPNKSEDIEVVNQYMESELGVGIIGNTDIEIEDLFSDYINKEIADDSVTEQIYSDMLEAYMNNNNIKCNTEPPQT